MEEKRKKLEEYKRALYIIDMNNGFVNFGAMANPLYNKLVLEQRKVLESFRSDDELVNFILEGHDKDAIEFEKYPAHCIKGTPEANLIPEFFNEQENNNTRIYYKNSINGMLNRDLQDDICNMKNLQEVVFGGVCADLCVMDFARTYSRFLDEINKKAKLFVVKSTIDTFDAPDHNKEEWMDIALKVMAQAGIEIVEKATDLENRERELKLR